MGAYAFSTDEYLGTVPTPLTVRVAAMSNVPELTAHPYGRIAAVDALYGPAEAFPVSVLSLAIDINMAADPGDIV